MAIHFLRAERSEESIWSEVVDTDYVTFVCQKFLLQTKFYDLSHHQTGIEVITVLVAVA